MFHHKKLKTMCTGDVMNFLQITLFLKMTYRKTQFNLNIESYYDIFVTFVPYNIQIYIIIVIVYHY